MTANYFKIALRYLLKNRTFSLINIVGLTLGFLSFILIALFIHDELSFDMFHRDSGRIYRLVQHESKEDGTTRNVIPVAAQVGPEAKKQLPEIEDFLHISALGRITVGNNPASRGYETTITTSENFFNFFDFPLIEGDPKTALSLPDAVVMNETVAKKYFGNQSPLGKTIWTSLTREGKRVEMIVTGVMQDFPSNSHIQMDMIFSESTWPGILSRYTEFVSSDWTSNNFVTYLKLRPGANEKILESKLSELVRANYPQDKVFRSTFTAQPLKRIHLYSGDLQGNEINSNGMKPFYLYMFGAVAILILLIAALNYMNLSTAAAFKRTREIGTRKTLGAQKLQLMAQFSGEAIILSTLSLIIALAILQVLLPSVNQFLDKELSLLRLPISWLYSLTGIMLASGLLSSLYPAFIISRVQPADAMKRNVQIGSSSIPVKKLLVVAQFTISIMMIASTLIIYRQLQYMRSKDLGFEVNNLLVVDINSNPLRRDFENVKAQFQSVPEVESISASTRVPGEWKSFPVATVKNSGTPDQAETIFVGIDDKFLQTYQIKLLAGRNFMDAKSDSTKVILTKLAAKSLNLHDPIGKVIEIPQVRRGGGIQLLEKPFIVEVIGVVDDFHFESFRQEMMPVIFGSANTPVQRIDYYTMKIITKDWDRTLSKLKEVNNTIAPDDPMEYTFLDARFEDFYRADAKRGQIFLVFSLIIVLIACLGLFALVSYSIESRTKEIGIRKVLGASVQNIVGMISKEFLVLIIGAAIIAIPITWFLMNKWLLDFAYHITIGPEIFGLSGILAILIALVTISLRTIRAAVMNPVKSLRTE